ncbi:hypothetical protein GCM10010442_65400 [Kitasatospora kifunensis]
MSERKPYKSDLELPKIGAQAPPTAEYAQVLVIMELRRSVSTGRTCACAATMADRTAVGSILGTVAQATVLPPLGEAAPRGFRRWGRE